MKRIGICTTGGDCSGLNATIMRLVIGAQLRGHKIFGLPDGTDILTAPAAAKMDDRMFELTVQNLPYTMNWTSGSFLKNGGKNNLNWQSGRSAECNANTRATLKRLKLDALIMLGGNGSLSLADMNRDAYAGVQFILIPKTMDMDVPMIDNAIGFSTAVEELSRHADQLLLNAQSHHRWFVIQAMGRESGFLALHAGVAANAAAILIPESKWKLDALIKHVKNHSLDYGVIVVSEGCQIRGRSGKPADIIVRELEANGITARASHLEHLQRVGDTAADDKILAARYAVAALNAIDNNETFVATSLVGNAVKTVDIHEVLEFGTKVPDPNIADAYAYTRYVAEDDPLLATAIDLGIFIS